MISEGELKIILRNLQIEADKLYNEFGATIEVIDLQSAINSLRNKYDIVDEKEIIYEKFVQ